MPSRSATAEATLVEPRHLARACRPGRVALPTATSATEAFDAWASRTTAEGGRSALRSERGSRRSSQWATRSCGRPCWRTRASSNEHSMSCCSAPSSQGSRNGGTRSTRSCSCSCAASRACCRWRRFPSRRRRSKARAARSSATGAAWRGGAAARCLRRSEPPGHAPLSNASFLRGG